MSYVDSVDWITGEITILQASMTIVQASPEIRELDIDLLRLELRDLEDDLDGRPWPRTHDHSTTETLVGTTYQRKVTFLDPYYFTFTGSNYSINLVNGDNNLSAFTPAYNARINTANSAGSTVVLSGSGLDAAQDAKLTELHTKSKHLAYSVFINTEALVAGDGSQKTPFDDLPTGLDYAETEGITDIVLLADIQLDRSCKNFRFLGIGQPTIDCNGKDLKGSEFFHCNMEGFYLNPITVQECFLKDGFWLNGNFEKNGLGGDLFCVDGATVFMLGNSSAVPGLGRPTISMNATGWCSLRVGKNNGGLTIKDCNNPLDITTVETTEGAMTFDASCNDGIMVARGTCIFDNLTTGALVHDQTESPVESRKVYDALFNYRKWDKIGNTITIYDDDKITPLYIFDTNADLSEITPQ